MTVLRAENLVKSYRRSGRAPLQILRGASFSVEAGERVAIVGKSGSGKTTLLDILGGLDSPDSGNVLVGGVPLFGGFSASRRRQRIRASAIGFVFQSYHLMPDLDVLGNVMMPFFAGRSGMSRRQARERALSLLSDVGLAERVSHVPAELSGGECQRVAIARALMRRPGLILADEPTGNLDSATGAGILDVLFSAAGRESPAVVMVTHSREAAMRCDRMLRLEDGVLSGETPSPEAPA